MAFPEGNKLFTGDPRANLDEKKTLTWFNLEKDGTGDGFSNIQDTFVESLQLQIAVLRQSMCMFKAGLSSSYDCWTKYQEKIPDVTDPD